MPSDDQSARRTARLSTALWHIRRYPSHEELIQSDFHTVQFDPQSDLWLDMSASPTLWADHQELADKALDSAGLL